MKYFKYRNFNKIKNLADKKRLASLEINEQKKVIRSRRLNKFLTICGTILFIIVFLACIFLIKLIPVPSNTFLSILYGIGCTILGLIGLIISVLATIFTFGMLISKITYDLPQIQKEFISNACEILRNYYGINDEYLITKCFESTNLNFNNHDICIFIYKNEIRITTDIVNGFVNGHCDLGCYSIKLDELKIYKDDYSNKRVTILEFGKEQFIVGIKAYSYIKKLIYLV